MLANRWAEKIARLCWTVAAVARLTANGKLSPAQFDMRMEQLFCPNAPSQRKIQNRLCILLSQGPELFGFYLALFELMFPVKNP